MAATDFNDPFWVAIATAAPVIGLASAVTADQLVRGYDRFRELVQEKPPVWQFLGAAFFIAYGNIALQAATLALALISLSEHADVAPKALVVTFAVAGLLLVILPTPVAIYRATR